MQKFRFKTTPQSFCCYTDKPMVSTVSSESSDSIKAVLSSSNMIKYR